MPRVADPSTPDRILDAVTPLFYARGTGAVGMAEVATAAGIGKAALYRCFASKDDLVVAYLERFAERITKARDRAVAGVPDDDALIALARHVASLVTRRDYRGCPFRNYLREVHDTRSRPGRYALAQVRGMRDLVESLAPDPEVAERVWLVLEGVYAAAPYPERVALADSGVALVGDLVTRGS